MFTSKPPLRLPPLSGADLDANPWSDEEIACWGIAGPPRALRMGPYKAHLFDIRIRYWYTITADHYDPDPSDPEWDELEDPYWCDVLRRTGHRGRDDFNHIEVNPVDGSLSFSLLLDRGLAGVVYHSPPEDPTSNYPHIPYTALEDRQYLEFSVETCTWKGEPCVFKQPLTRRDVAMIDNEIAIMKRLEHSPHIVHFIGYVVDEDGDLRGILLPWAGVKIDSLPTVRWSFFCDIVYGLSDIHSLTLPESEMGEEREASHGDIFCRNILVKDGVARLIDSANEGLDYPGDHQAFLDVLLALKDKAEGDVDKSRIAELEAWLRAGMSFAQLSEKVKKW